MLEIAGLLQCCGGVSETMFLVKCPCPVFLPVLNTDIRQAPGIHCPSCRLYTCVQVQYKHNSTAWFMAGYRRVRSCSELRTVDMQTGSVCGYTPTI